MKKLICLILVGIIGLINAQGVRVDLGTSDATSSFEVRDMNALPLARVQGDAWTGFGDAIPPQHPFHFSTSYGDWYTPAALFVSTAPSVDAYGVMGQCDNTDYFGYGVFGLGGYIGVGGDVYAEGDGLYYGVNGYVGGGTGTNHGVYGTGSSGTKAYGGYFESYNASDRSYGAWGEASGSPHNYGLYGKGSVAASGGNTVGVLGDAQGANAINYGVYGYATGATTNWAGYFIGNVHVTGTLSKAAGAFKIDHPKDPENKYLSHSFVESPDMMNIYNGNVELNYSGEADIELPDWFNSLNSDFRYQLTAIGAPGPNLYIAQEVNGNTFRIAGGNPGMKVSWQITGIRQDAYAVNNRIKVEEYKTGDDIGKYLHPEEHGMPQSKQINYDLISQEKKVLAKDKKQMKTRK